jgi:hypothetical protein
LDSIGVKHWVLDSVKIGKVVVVVRGDPGGSGARRVVVDGGWGGMFWHVQVEKTGMEFVSGMKILLSVCSFSHGGVWLVFFEKFWGVEVLVIDPRVIWVWISFPVDKVLELFALPPLSVSDDRFDFIFVFSLIDYGRGACIRRAICLRLLIWQKKVDVEYIIYLHVWW